MSDKLLPCPFCGARFVDCTAPLASSGLVQVCDDDFCSYGFREEEDE